MYLMAVPLNIEAIRSQIAEGLDVLIHIAKTPSGKRMITEITELTGYEEGRFLLNPIMKTDSDGQLSATGNSLKNTDKILLKGEEDALALGRLGFIRG